MNQGKEKEEKNFCGQSLDKALSLCGERGPVLLAMSANAGQEDRSPYSGSDEKKKWRKKAASRDGCWLEGGGENG